QYDDATPRPGDNPVSSARPGNLQRGQDCRTGLQCLLPGAAMARVLGGQRQAGTEEPGRGFYRLLQASLYPEAESLSRDVAVPAGLRACGLGEGGQAPPLRYRPPPCRQLAGDQLVNRVLGWPAFSD